MECMKDFCSPFEARKVMPLIQVPVGVRINIIFGSITRYVIGDFGGGDILRNLLHQTGDSGPLHRSSRYSSNLINSHPPYPSLTKIQQWQQASSSQALVNVPFVSWAAL